MATNNSQQPGESNQLIASPWHTLFVVVAAETKIFLKNI